MDDTLKKLFDAKASLAKFSVWVDEIVISALHTGEQFYRDHKRPMTYAEKKDWLESKRKLMRT